MDEVTRAVIDSQKMKWQCILCEENTLGRGIYVPLETKKDGKTCVSIYGICGNCSSCVTKDKNEKIKKYILQRNN